MNRVPRNVEDDIYEFDEIDETDGLIKLALKKKEIITTAKKTNK